MLETHGLTRRFGALVAVDDLSVSLPSGGVTGFLGPNGAGKTTTIRMIAGALRPTSGRVVIEGIDAASDPAEARRRIGYLPESTPLHPELRVDEFLAFRGRLHGLHGPGLRRALDSAIARCSLTDARRRLIGVLSKGFRQRVGLAAALLHDPPVLILDEPTSGLDPSQIQEFRALLRQLAERHTVLLSSHVLAEIEAVCNQIVMISGGRLVARGSLDELRARAGTANRITLEIEGDPVEVLRGLVEVEAIRPLGRVDSWHRSEIAGGDEGRLRTAIAQRCLERRVPLRELSPRPLSLEELFLALTTESVTRGGGR